MKVPINPETNVPSGQLEYERPVDVSAGTRALGDVVEKWAGYAAEERKKREIFDVQKMLVDETNNLQQDFDAKKQVQPLGAPNFVQQVNGEYNTRHMKLVQGLKDQGYSPDAVNEFAARLGTMRSQYVAQAIDFEAKSNFAKVNNDADQMGVSLSQYANTNPGAAQSALEELHVALQHSGLDAIEAEQVYQKQKDVILAGAREGFATQHPDVVLGLYGLGHELTTVSPSPAALPAGQEFNLPGYIEKIGPKTNVEGTGKNPRSSAVGYFQFTKGTWLDKYKEVYGNTKETKDQILAKRKDQSIATRLVEKLTSDNVKDLIAANFPVNDTTVYLSHFLGVHDAIKVLSAYADQTMQGLIQNNSIASNPNVFKKVKTVSDLISWAQDRMGVEPSSTGTPSAQMAVLPIPKNWRGNQEDAIQELGMTADQAAKFLKTGKDPRTGPKQGMITPGNIDVLQLPAVPNPDGSVSTVRSISIEQDGKEYLIPTVINGRVVSDQEAVASFQETGNHLGVFTDAKSADAYAQQLHESEARRVASGMAPTVQQAPGIILDENGKTGIQALDLATPSERLQMLVLARTVMNEREAEVKTAQREAHSSWLNQFYNGLEDGRLGQNDLNQAYQSGQLGDFDERRKAQGILDDKNKDQSDFELFHQMLQSGGKFNPYDERAQKAVDAGFKNAVKVDQQKGGVAGPFMIALRAWQRTGILPTQGGVMIRGALISTDAQQVASAVSVASNMLKENPNAFAGVDGGEEIAQRAADFTHYVDDLGMTQEQAVQKIATENDPQFKAKNKVDETVKNAFISSIMGKGNHPGVDINKVVNDAVLGPRGWGSTLTLHLFDPTRGTFTPSQQAEARQTYLELALDNFDKNHDPGAAQAYAARQMSRFYGLEGNRLIKYPATKAYPEIMGSRDYIYTQAAQLVNQTTKLTVAPADVTLVPTTTGSTAAAFRAGKAVPYEVHYVTRDQNGQAIYHVIPGKVFVADVDQARREAAVKAREIEKQTREATKQSDHRPVDLTFSGIPH